MSQPKFDDEDELYPIAPEPVAPRPGGDSPPELLEPGKQFVYRVFKPPGRTDYFTEAMWGFVLPLATVLSVSAGLVYFGQKHVVPIGLMLLPIGAIGAGFSYMALAGMKQLGNARGRGPARIGMGVGFLEGVAFLAILTAMVLRRVFMDD
jgi:hypothetical protein